MDHAASQLHGSLVTFHAGFGSTGDDETYQVNWNRPELPHNFRRDAAFPIQ